MNKKYSRRSAVPKLIHIGTTIDAEMDEALEAFCEEEDRTRAWVIRKAIEQYIERNGK